MAGTIYSGTYTSGISLYNPATQRPVTVTGKITAATGDGIIGSDGFAWTVNNKGTVDSTASSGIQLLAGGTVNNLVAGSVSPGGISGAALIAGYNNGVLIEFAPARVANLGEIEATGTAGAGINIFAAGGTVTNGSAADTTALITGGGSGINVNGGAGAVTNFGTVASTNSGNGVHLFDGGSVVNGSAASTAALISSAGGHTAVYINGGAGNVTNFGAIKGGSVGVFLGDGGRVSSGSSTSTAAEIIGAKTSSVSIAGTTGTVVNFGTLQTLGTLANVALNGGGSVTNGAAGATGASITGTGFGIYINNAPGTVANFGTITSTDNSILLEDGGIVSNFGTIKNTVTSQTAIYFKGGGNLINGKGARIAGGNNGISIRGLATVTNSGSITGSDPTGTGDHGNGIYLVGAGSIVNQSGGVIAGHNQGVYNRNFAITVTNSGLIETTGAADGVYLRGGGTIINNVGATIAGSAAGVKLGQHGGAVTNHGVIKGVIGFYAGIFRSGANTLINFGTVASTVAGGVAVQMGASVGLEKLLVVEKGAVFTGLVEGGGRGEIMFAGNGAVAMGANISGFDRVALANGGSDSLTLTSANFAGVDGRLMVIGGNDGNTVNAAAVTIGQLTIDGGAGTDTLTGSANGGTIFVFAASALTAADKITGGGGFNNELDLTTSGPVAVNGVSAVEIYRLANGGADTLTLTNANFVGAMGLKVVYGGNGGNTIDGSTLAAANGLDIYGGAGLDVLKGGAGNDIFVFTAAALTASDTVSGGGGSNELLMTSAGTIHADKVSAVETYVLADGGANILTLASGNFTGTGGPITVSGGNGGNTVALAAGLPAADRLVAYAGSGPDILTGGAGNDVFYAGGSTAMRGKAGTNEFVFSGIGNNTIADFGASTGNAIVFSNSGFHLGLGGASATPKPLPSGLFVADATGTFTLTSERFAYGTTTGKLFYSAAGTTATEHLVATLAGAPSLTASHLFFIT